MFCVPTSYCTGQCCRRQVDGEKLDRQRRIATASPVATKEHMSVGPGQHGHTVVDGLNRTGLRRERSGRRPAAPGLGTVEGVGNRQPRSFDLGILHAA